MPSELGVHGQGGSRTHTPQGPRVLSPLRLPFRHLPEDVDRDLDRTAGVGFARCAQSTGMGFFGGWVLRNSRMTAW